MRRLPWIARVYVSAVIALGALAVATTLPDVQFPRPALFVALLALSVISSAMKVDMPVGVGSSCISLSYAVDFTALLLLGPGAAMLIAMASAWAQCTLPDERAESAASDALQHRQPGADGGSVGSRLHLARWHLRAIHHDASAASGCRDDLLSRELGDGGRRLRSCEPARHLPRVARQLSLEHHELRGWRDSRGRRRRGLSTCGALADVARVHSFVPDVSHLSDLSRADRRRAAPGDRMGATAPRKHGSAGAGDSGEGRRRDQSRGAGAGTTRRTWRAPSNCPRRTRTPSRSPRFCTTSASLRFRSTSSRSQAR